MAKTKQKEIVPVNTAQRSRRSLKSVPNELPDVDQKDIPKRNSNVKKQIAESSSLINTKETTDSSIILSDDCFDKSKSNEIVQTKRKSKGKRNSIEANQGKTSSKLKVESENLTDEPKELSGSSENALFGKIVTNDKVIVVSSTSTNNAECIETSSIGKQRKSIRKSNLKKRSQPHEANESLKEVVISSHLNTESGENISNLQRVAPSNNDVSVSSPLAIDDTISAVNHETINESSTSCSNADMVASFDVTNKDNQETKADDSSEDEPLISAKNGKRNKFGILSEDEEENIPLSAKKIKRNIKRPGRKKIIDSNESFSVSEEETVKHKTKSKRGRPPNSSGNAKSRRKRTIVESDESFSMSEKEEEGTVKHNNKSKRGRRGDNITSKKSTEKSVPNESLASRRTSRVSKVNKKYVESSPDSDEDDEEEVVSKKVERIKPNVKVATVVSSEIDKPRKRGRKRIETEADKTVPMYVSQEFSSGNVICQICKEEMSDEHYKTEHKRVHNYLCWSDREPPMNFYDNDFVLKLFKLVPGPYACEVCGDIKRSAPGYYAHFLQCGRSEEDKEKSYIYCEVCDQKYLIPYFAGHLYKHATLEDTPTNEEVTEPNTEELDVSSSKRSAAQRAVSKISQITSDVVIEEEEEDPTAYKKKRKPKEDEEFTLMEDDEVLIEEEEEDESDEVESEQEEDAFDEDEGVVEDLSDLMLDEERMRNFAAAFFRTVNDMSYAYKRLKSLFSESPLHENLLPPSFEWLKDAAADQYLPLNKKSVTFDFRNQESQTLPLFSCSEINGNSVIFCGGPVWAMAWMPLPRDSQYLAVASHRDMEKTHKKNIPESYKSLIQIWKFPDISRVRSGNKFSPTMVFGIAHEEGAVWAMEWCPSGGVIPGKRMGLLAAACSSGRIVLYAVPDLDHVEYDSTESRVCNLQPVLKLQLEEDMITPCIRLTWMKASPHDLIFAGYADGYVAVFDISSTSDTVLRDNLMLPISMFHAHSGEVMAVSVGYYSTCQILFTAGVDRLGRIWDLSDISNPLQVVSTGVNVMKRSLLGAMVPFLPMFSFTHDVSVGLDQSNFCPYLIRDFAYIKDSTRMVLPQTRPNFSLSFSPICNLHLTGDENGGLYATYYGDTTFMTRVNKSHEAAKLLLETKLVTQDEDADGASYKGAAAKYHLSFSYVKRDVNMSPREEFEDYDLANITCVQWNCNVKYLLYLAAGLKCGLVHVMNSHMISQNTMKRFQGRIKS